MYIISIINIINITFLDLLDLLYQIFHLFSNSHGLSFVSTRGKFGQVFKLVEKSTKKVWAGKFIKAFSQKEKENVRQEIGIMNSLHHPKLVQCVDAFEGKSDMVMVLEMWVPKLLFIIQAEGYPAERSSIADHKNKFCMHGKQEYSWTS